MRNPIVKVVFIILAFISLALGFVGVVVPVLPTTPFLLLSSFLFAKGSDSFHRWFLSTSIYKNHLEEFIRTRSMTLRKKLSIQALASIMLIFSATLTDSLFVRIFILSLILFIYYYFYFHIRTIRPED